MNVIYYPDKTEINTKEEHKGPVVRFLEDLSEKQPDLWALVNETMDLVKRSSNLRALENNKWIRNLKGIKLPIKEFRIPPKRQRGVVRLYFAYKKNDSNTIFILSGELKQGKIDADEIKIKQAEQRYKEVCL